MAGTIRRSLVVVVSLATATLCVRTADATLILGVTATTNMGSGFGTSLQNTVNGVGLVPGQALDAIHVATIPSNSWVSSTGVLTGFVTFNLNGLYDLSGISFWNQNAGGPGAAGSTGIMDVQILTSINGTTFTPLANGPTQFARATGTTSPPQMFSFAPVLASFVRFNILSNYGDASRTGFAEVAFNGTVIPEPSTLVMGGTAALAGLGCVLRRRRRATA